MERFLNDYDLVTVEENVKILILKCFEYKNENYAYCQNLSKYDADNPEYIFVKEEIVDNEPFVKILTEENEVSEVLAYLKNVICG